MPEPKRRLAAALTLFGAIGVWLIWFVMVNHHLGQFVDSRALAGSYIGAWRVDGGAKTILHTVSMPAAIIFAVLIVLTAWLHGRAHRAIYATVAVLGANLTTQVLKHVVFSRPMWGFSERWDGANTLPSGHTTIAATAAVALVMVTSARWRPLAAWIGATLAFLMGYSTLVAQWHRPSDVAAALLVAATWGWAMVALGAFNDHDRLRGKPVMYPEQSHPIAKAARVGTALLGWLALLSLIASIVVAGIATVTSGVGIALIDHTPASTLPTSWLGDMLWYATGAGLCLSIATGMMWSLLYLNPPPTLPEEF
ncbi:phosphatase PAP2 family protein [Actinomyces vulturis]|uniref:phosphatase PAP2 family protein n=1 Tax=Actinomyces vulturis TaxID=1857645 RepID=UPI00083025F3|nr:phosphatase PAP2 family protein [Actinomyces vulturis]